MASKVRLDAAMAALGLVRSRERAQRLVMAGRVRVNGQPAPKPGRAVDPSADTIAVSEGEKYASRGGYKLEAALDRFAISCAGRICLDLGASTGGFTDCLLQRGARRVFAVDVGRGQLDARLAADSRVLVLDGVNARRLVPAQLPETPDLATADVSFISLEKVLPAAAACARPGADFVTLVKPQFEVGRRQVGRGGVVRDVEARLAALERIRDFVRKTLNAEWLGDMESPLRGPAGNLEYLAWFRLPATSAARP
ncbi:MAG: TlyA family RNA methyltransferase [Verrucomicrobiae bacterium]|nr:TlyA family RNA methyltransferase [Verrucomicrobiae bacterium]